MIDYFLTKHAKERFNVRKITIKLIEDALSNPTQLSTDGAGKWLYKKLYAGKEKLRLLILVAIVEDKRLKILTLIDTSKVKKYLKL